MEIAGEKTYSAQKRRRDERDKFYLMLSFAFLYERRTKLIQLKHTYNYGYIDISVHYVQVQVEQVELFAEVQVIQSKSLQKFS